MEQGTNDDHDPSLLLMGSSPTQQGLRSVSLTQGGSRHGRRRLQGIPELDNESQGSPEVESMWLSTRMGGSQRDAGGLATSELLLSR